MIYINGRFLTKKITGVVRYAYEVTKQFDKPDFVDKITILIPKNVKINFSYEYLKIKAIGSLKGNLWEQLSLSNFMKKHKGDKLLNLCNSSPLSISSYTVVHDLTFLYKPRTYSLPFTIWYKFLIKKKIKKDKVVFTDSEFSKNEIIKYYNVDPKKIIVVYCGTSEPFKEIDNSLVKKYKLEHIPYYLFVGSNYPHKNINLIFDLANKNPSKTFVIVSENLEHEYIKNVAIINEKITNKQLNSLYRNADTLMMLSKYEGFGLPPLEALVNGTKHLLLSDIPVFREIYGNEPNYIDLNNVKLPLVMNNLPKNYLSSLAKKYSWNAASQIILKELMK